MLFLHRRAGALNGKIRSVACGSASETELCASGLLLMGSKSIGTSTCDAKVYKIEPVDDQRIVY